MDQINRISIVKRKHNNQGKGMTMRRKLLKLIPPGEILCEEFMKPMGISINASAHDIAVPPNRLS